MFLDFVALLYNCRICKQSTERVSPHHLAAHTSMTSSHHLVAASLFAARSSRAGTDLVALFRSLSGDGTMLRDLNSFLVQTPRISDYFTAVCSVGFSEHVALYRIIARGCSDRICSLHLLRHFTSLQSTGPVLIHSAANSLQYLVLLHGRWCGVGSLKLIIIGLSTGIIVRARS
jgi:hypothetical protein